MAFAFKRNGPTALAAICFFLGTTLLFYFMNLKNPQPYMDEIFHVRQAQHYCRGNWDWDPAITTPPGLYLLSLVLSPILGCSVGALRFVNAAALVLIAPVVLFDILKQLHPQSSNNALIMRTLSMCSLPPLWFVSGLYYTDTWSTVLFLQSQDD
ncbi:dolichyl-phosphate-glucose-glycolipid alpha- glucosyltransferase Alg10 [Schizosaccharomyces japonicus yFS275]|uniref:Dol-P-Glc:Glc(2)Man(9)GlcNAc(2)-PP-Dol alpha-1,2-glucosyltransferase n=1 Tax=Schizosaccharomyces japonicus (strain yFS275 / FY16936) TaxID=402676 RepID=B6K2W5_SCHJY|nr:dolichyl-phosphate-glucose-glycolipid alpha- glucosyltransferase Alg10 [Schizosaccharomyces japonicus yFS275]EEB08605.2 dolichyl-phosphate-glucose-glycolipid alpha- glucosyltransferase Alg10 [Schizosaccharomyces japonicus yFS275]